MIAVHSTVHPDTCRRLADRARTHGVSLIDAPVSGGGPAAAEGTGQVAKLLNNVLFTANLATAADTLALGRDLAIAPAALARVLAHGSAGSFALNRVAAAGGTLDRLAIHVGPLLRKDVRLVTDVAEAAGAEPDVVTSAATAALALMNRHQPTPG